MTISTLIIEKESYIRVGFFLGMIIIMGTWEIYRPKRILLLPKLKRWVNNLSLVFFNSILLNILFPIASTGVAIVAAKENYGLLNYYEVSPFIATIIFIIAMDFIIYCQHVLFHITPVLWKLHRVHHADLDYDVTTGSRFHTIEIFISHLIKFMFILILGPSVFAVIIFEVLLNAMAMFNHSNIGLAKPLDKILRMFIVTPDMHRIHHSSVEDETNSNYGFNLTWWDKIFKTYKQEAGEKQTEMEIGLKDIRDPKQSNQIIGMLTLPFK